MPISKSGKLYYTEEQYRYARYECSALEYAKANGYRLVRVGNYYTLEDHDSFVFGTNGMWFWNSRDMRGGAIEFLTMLEQRPTVEAVLILNGEISPQQDRTQNRHNPNTYQLKTEDTPKQKPFELPEKSGSYKRLFAYLISSRKLDAEIVQSLVKQKLIYQGVNRFQKDGTMREAHNAVFVTYNENGQAVAGFQRGIATVGKPFKGDIPGSDKEHYGWFMPGQSTCDTICVFEASIDAISHATLEKLRGNDYMTAHRMALGGNLNLKPIMRYLEAHPETKSIRICLDNDTGGETGTKALATLLKENGYTKENGYCILREKPADYKDFNEMLQAHHAEHQQTPRQEAAAERPEEPEPVM